MLSCKEVNVLASKALDTRLSGRERWAIRMHLMFCNLCRRYVRQLNFLHRATEWIKREQVELYDDVKLPEEARGRIRRALEEA